jgi:hypothetical protein
LFGISRRAFGVPSLVQIVSYPALSRRFGDRVLRGDHEHQHDARTVVGLAALWRPLAAATAWRGTLEELASQLGVFRAATQRSEGRRYWPNLAGKIARIANDGGFGKLFVEGVDPGSQTTVVLTPSAELMDAYQRLREVREEKRTSEHTANQEAAVRRLLLRAKKKRK